MTTKQWGLKCALAHPAVILSLLTLALQTGCPPSTPSPPNLPSTPATTEPARTEIKVTVEPTGYTLDRSTAPAGAPVRLVFTRKSDEGCGEDVVFPALGIKQKLPLNEAVAIDITMPRTGSVAFSCGMDMLKGSLLVGPASK